MWRRSRSHPMGIRCFMTGGGRRSGGGRCGHASLDPMGGWFEGRGDALSKGVGDCVRPVDLSGRCGPVSAQGRARSSTPGIVHRRSWHSTTGGRASRTHVGRVGADAASSPGPAGDDAARGRLCTTLRRDELHRPDRSTGRTQSPTPWTTRRATRRTGSSGIMRRVAHIDPSRYDDYQVFIMTFLSGDACSTSCMNPPSAIGDRKGRIDVSCRLYLAPCSNLVVV